jgi:hypothetical protein
MADIGRCKICGTILAVINGVVQDHNKGLFKKAKCPGSGKPPKE